MRDTIHSELTATLRARRHRAVGEALKSLPRDDADRLPALALHFAEAATAGGAIKAADYAIAAAIQAFTQSAWENAVRFLERGLEALDVHEPPDLGRRCDLLLAETWCRFFDTRRMRKAAEQAVEVARALGSPERFGRAVRWYLTSGPNLANLGEEALALLGDGYPGLRALILARLQDPAAAEDNGRKALKLARESGDSEALGVVLRAMSFALAESGKAAERLAIAEEMVSAAPPGGWDGWRGRYEQRAVARLVVGDRRGFEADARATAQQGREGCFWF